MVADVEEVEIVVAHHEHTTLRVGDVFLKIDTDHDTKTARQSQFTIVRMSERR